MDHARGTDVLRRGPAPECERDRHMVAAMARFMACILETKPCLFVRSAQFLSWVAADAPTCDRWCDALSDALRGLAAETVAADGVPSGGDRQLALIETEEINPTEEVR